MQPELSAKHMRRERWSSLDAHCKNAQTQDGGELMKIPQVVQRQQIIIQAVSIGAQNRINLNNNNSDLCQTF